VSGPVVPAVGGAIVRGMGGPVVPAVGGAIVRGWVGGPARRLAA
jgi:hypothetical protein